MISSENNYNKKIKEDVKMEYKTPMIAEKMGVSTKVVMRIVQQLNLEIKK
ncbi:hypothetical protein GCM10020331_064260 [Ectobacillus funiculus]